MLFAAAVVGLTLVLCFLVTHRYETDAVEKAKGDLARLIQLQAVSMCTPKDFSGSMDLAERKRAEDHFLEISRIPDLLMTNIISPGGVVLWSTSPDEIGEQYSGDNDLREALGGKVATNIAVPYHGDRSFRDVKEILEIYVPVRFPGDPRVAGVIEIYQDMAPLRSSIFKTNLAVSGTLLGGVGTLYLLLYGMVRRLNRRNEANQEALRRSREKAQSHRMELIKRICASAIGATGVEGLLREAAREACGMLELPRCSIRIFGEPDIVVEHCETGSPPSEPAVPAAPRPGDSKEIREKGVTLVVGDARTSAWFAGTADEPAGVRLGAYIGVPLRVPEGTIGALFLYRVEPHEWTEDEVRTAEALGRQVAVAIRHVRLFETHQELAGRLVSLMDNVPGTVYRGLRDWSLAFSGAAIERLTGYSAKEFLDRSVNWQDVVHHDDLEMLRRRLREAVAGKENTLCIEYRILRRDGETRWIEDRRQLVYDPAGAFLHVDGLLIDITENKLAAEMRLVTQFAVDRSGDAAYWMNRDGRLIYVNERACRILGYAREELLSRTIHDIAPDFTPQAWAVHWEDLRARKSCTMETRNVAKDGRSVPVEVTVNYVEFDGKEYNCVSARDLTERIEAQERSRHLQTQLQESRKMEAIANLAGGIAHDFNNLLTTILGYANLLRDSGERGSEVSQAAEAIQDSAERASQLTAKLLGFARRGKHLVVPIDVCKVIDGVAGILERTVDERIRIRKEFGPGVQAVDGDPAQLQQFLLNLAWNACDAMPDGGEMTISTGIEELDGEGCDRHPGMAPGKYVRIAVADTGVGIPPSNMGKIFDPFFTTKEQGKGTGLGLSMVFGIVKNHGGHIEVESRVGEGSRFTVFLPRSAGVPQEEPDIPREGERGTKKGCVLFVDDQEAVRDVCGAMLQNLGYTVIKAVDGLDGVEQYRRHAGRIDLVLLDMVMPNLGGRDCYLRIKAMNPGVRAVLTTGFSMDGAVQEIMKEGITGFLQKPFRLDQLAYAVEKALGRDAGSFEGGR